MTEDSATQADFGEIEAMVRAAGEYVEVSDDLRPRTLEDATFRGREASNRSWIAILTVVIFFLAICAGRLASTSPLEGLSSGGDQLYSAADKKATQSNANPSWKLADAFSELRQRQLSLIEDAFWH